MILSRVSLAFAATTLLATSACQMTEPNNPNRNTQSGAAIGATLGALVGIAAGDNAEERRRGAVLGAVLGGGIGGVAGRNLDKQEAELRAQMGNQIGIQNTGNKLIVTMPQDILFATDSANISGSLQNDLFTLARSLNNYPDTTVNIIGHTDNVGSASYNQQLSTRRAQSVSSVLVNAGVAPYRINAFGRGEDQPVADNITAAGRAQNRRVEIVITPKI